jgi:TonB family protein
VTSAGISGEATVRFLVRKDGSVGEVTLVKSTQREFADPTMEAARRWKFEPPKHRHTQASTQVWMTCRVMFKRDEA